MTDWYVGQKVVCIDGRFPWDRATGLWTRLFCRTVDPRKGDICVIRRVFVVGDEVVLGLVGYGGASGRVTFSADAFRPLVSQNADLSVFHDILRKLPTREGVR